VYEQAGCDLGRRLQHPSVWLEGRVFSLRMTFTTSSRPGASESSLMRGLDEAYHLLRLDAQGGISTMDWGTPLYGAFNLTVRFSLLVAALYALLALYAGLTVGRRLLRRLLRHPGRPADPVHVVTYVLVGFSALTVAVGAIGELGEQARFRDDRPDRARHGGTARGPPAAPLAGQPGNRRRGRGAMTTPDDSVAAEPVPATLTAPAPSPVKVYTGALDGLRGYAAIIVVMVHARVSWMQGGTAIISTFFPLSGFLITRNLLREVDRTQRIDFSRFWSRRVRRLLPASAIGVAVATSASLYKPPDPGHRHDLLAHGLEATGR
jgi:hypothetical protein